jgi:CubicO group peptidase (beta-lactamase class C family)
VDGRRLCRSSRPARLSQRWSSPGWSITVGSTMTRPSRMSGPNSRKRARRCDPGAGLSHQAGLPGYPDEMEPSDWFDRDLMEDRFAAMAPMWPLGEGSGYHPISYGVIADAVVRRADAKHRTVGAILRDEICGPRGIDFHIGVPESEHDRAAEHVLPPRPPHLGSMTPRRRRPSSSPGPRLAGGGRRPGARRNCRRRTDMARRKPSPG